MTTIDRPATDPTPTPPADPPAGPAAPPPKPSVLLGISLEPYAGRTHRYRLAIRSAGPGGEELCHDWFGSRAEAVRMGQEWVRANGYHLTEEG
jgi:hypothetical protein